MRFSSHVKRKPTKLSLLHKNLNTSSHREGNLVALTTVYLFELRLKVRDMSSKLSLPRQGPWNWVWVKQVFQFSEVKLSEFQCMFKKTYENINIYAYVWKRRAQDRYMHIARAGGCVMRTCCTKESHHHLFVGRCVWQWICLSFISVCNNWRTVWPGSDPWWGFCVKSVAQMMMRINCCYVTAVTRATTLIASR